MGGAIMWASINATVVNCSFVGCSAGNGGAIYLYTSNGAVSGCIFDLSSASIGNVIYTNTTIDVEGNFFATNNAISADEFIANHFVCNNGVYVAPEMVVVLKFSI